MIRGSVRRVIVVFGAAWRRSRWPASFGGGPRRPDEVFARLRSAMRDAATRIPNYTCIETIERRTFVHIRPLGPPGPLDPRYNQAASGPPRDCKELAALKTGRDYTFDPAGWDRLRLDVRVGEGGEIIRG